MHCAFRKTAGAEGSESSFSEAIQHAFGNDAASGVASAKKQDVVWSISHGAVLV
jgi:hypothetical protein